MAGHPIVMHSVAQQFPAAPMQREDWLLGLVFSYLQLRTKSVSTQFRPVRRYL